MDDDVNDLKDLMRENYLQYASYVILDRAIPSVVDGLKPVQRRILYILHRLDDGRLHKVMNVAGQTMSLHPHGDAPIVDALVNMASKHYLLDQQGNFGNLYTGDPAAAPRYIETRLSTLAKEVMFNPDLTEMIPSYDGRTLEPIGLPAKIPLVLLQGAEGIAVGMSTRILPHNFVELIEAEIATLEGKEHTLLPDLPTGAIMDASDYNKGKGKVKLRASIEEKDPKTLVITEICYGTTTESVIRSIDEAAKRGKIKIESINDYTSDQVEIEIKLLRGHYAKDLIEPLYAYTDCEVSVSSQILVIKDGMPWDTDVHEVLCDHVGRLQTYLQKELQIEEGRLLEKIFLKTLERIFIENRLYKKIETISIYEKIHSTIEKSIEPFYKELYRIPAYDDREKLLNIPIRRISRFDLNKNHDEIDKAQQSLARVQKDLKSIKHYTIRYLKHLLKSYGKFFPRKTRIATFEEIDRRAIDIRPVKVYFDPKSGFVGTKVRSDIVIEGTSQDKLLVLYKDGSYKVIYIPEKEYLDTGSKSTLYVGIADKKTVFSALYRDPKTHLCYAKRFAIRSFMLEKEYRYFEKGMKLEYFTAEKHHTVLVRLIPKPKQRLSKVEFALDGVMVKGVAAKGVRICSREVKRVQFLRQKEGA